MIRSRTAISILLASLYLWGAVVEAFVVGAARRTCSPTSSAASTLFSKRRPRSDENFYDGEDDGDDPYYSANTRYAGDSIQTRELRSLKYPEADDEEEDEGDYTTDVDDLLDDDDDLMTPSARRTTSRQRYITDDEYEDDYYYNDDDEKHYDNLQQQEDEKPLDVGNFWSNPKEALDPIPPRSSSSSRRRRRRPSPRRSSSSTSTRDLRRGRRTSFRSGAPSSPKSISEFYERLFWYGFDTDENMAVGDKTMFGGTKGKFNGLQLFGASNDRPPAKRRRDDTPQQFRADEWYEDMMGSINDAPRRPELPPSRPKRRRSDDYAQDGFDLDEPPLEDSRRSRRRRAERRDPTASDWVSKEVSTWFQDDDNDELEDEETDKLLWKRSHRRPRSRDEQKSPWSITGVLDNVFGVDRDEMDMNAVAYNRQMGLGPKTRRPSNRERRRAGYAYRYDDDEDDIPPVADIDPIGEPAVVDALDVEAVAEEEGGVTGEPRPRRRERSWEERALAVERVPPSGVAAWGPTGEVGVDARTKATLDALEEIREATRKVELKEEQCIDAREELVVLKA
jgi:hypothetical protein